MVDYTLNTTLQEIIQNGQNNLLVNLSNYTIHIKIVNNNEKIVVSKPFQCVMESINEFSNYNTYLILPEFIINELSLLKNNIIHLTMENVEILSKKNCNFFNYPFKAL